MLKLGGTCQLRLLYSPVQQRKLLNACGIQQSDGQGTLQDRELIYEHYSFVKHCKARQAKRFQAPNYDCPIAHKPRCDLRSANVCSLCRSSYVGFQELGARFVSRKNIGITASGADHRTFYEVCPKEVSLHPQ